MTSKRPCRVGKVSRRTGTPAEAITVSFEAFAPDGGARPGRELQSSGAKRRLPVA